MKLMLLPRFFARVSHRYTRRNDLVINDLVIAVFIVATFVSIICECFRCEFLLLSTRHREGYCDSYCLICLYLCLRNNSKAVDIFGWSRSCYRQFQQAVREAATICHRPLQVDLWPFDLENGVRVTCDVGYLWANFSLHRPLCQDW